MTANRRSAQCPLGLTPTAIGSISHGHGSGSAGRQWGNDPLTNLRSLSGGANSASNALQEAERLIRMVSCSAFWMEGTRKRVLKAGTSAGGRAGQEGQACIGRRGDAAPLKTKS